MKNYNRHTTYEVVKRILVLLICVAIIVAMSVTRDNKLLGHELKGDAATAVDTAVITKNGNNQIVVNTSSLSKEVIGYAGTTPLRLYITGEKIDSVVPLDNQETPDFFQAVEDELIPYYRGKKIKEVLATDVDGVTGATFSSKAVKANVALGLKALTAQQAEAEKSFAYKALDEAKAIGKSIAEGGVGAIMALLVSLMAAILPLIIKNKTYRLVQMLLNVAVLGVWTGTFISYSSLVGIMSNGYDLTKPLAIFVLLIVAFIYPLFGRKNYYCTWCCPMGSAQDLAFRVKVNKFSLTAKSQRRLKVFRLYLWSVLMLLSWFGVTFSWMNYEFFIAFIWQAASWIIIVLAVLTIVISAFIPRPYCRFVCPTGSMLKMN